MFVTRTFLLVSVLFHLGCATSSYAQSRVDSDLQAFDAKVAELRAEFSKHQAKPKDKEWVKLKLAHMFEVDQYMRKYHSVPHDRLYSSKEKEDFLREFAYRSTDIDTSNTRDLKQLLEIYDWFKISEFGEKLRVSCRSSCSFLE